jgi:hypothetical protein
MIIDGKIFCEACKTKTCLYGRGRCCRRKGPQRDLTLETGMVEEEHLGSSEVSAVVL